MSLITQKRVYVIISTKIMAPILFESYNKFKKEKIESRHSRNNCQRNHKNMSFVIILINCKIILGFSLSTEVFTSIINNFFLWSPHNKKNIYNNFKPNYYKKKKIDFYCPVYFDSVFMAPSMWFVWNLKIIHIHNKTTWKSEIKKKTCVPIIHFLYVDVCVCF